MLKTYFFIPANNRRFIDNALSSIKADFFIFELEDSISELELGNAVSNLRGIDILEKHYVRCNLFINTSTEINSEQVVNLVEMGFRNFVIPKFSDINHIKLLTKFLEGMEEYSYSEFRFILLIEHPAGILNLNDVLKNKLLNITSVGLGNYDYCNIMGMKHTLENLMFPRQMVLTYAKAYGIEAIDIVSLELNDDESYRDEVKNGFSMGFDAKFIIHPKQLSLMDGIEYYSEAEVEEAIMVYSKIKQIQKNEIAVAKVNGKIYEKPHIDRILKIINWSENYGSK